MNALSFTKRIIRGPRDQSPVHRFQVGQLVRSKGALTRESIIGDTYRITATLPIRDMRPSTAYAAATNAMSA